MSICNIPFYETYYLEIIVGKLNQFKLEIIITNVAFSELLPIKDHIFYKILLRTLCIAFMFKTYKLQVFPLSFYVGWGETSYIAFTHVEVNITGLSLVRCLIQSLGHIYGQ